MRLPSRHPITERPARRSRLIAAMMASALLAACTADAPASRNDASAPTTPPVILVSLDGFRADYITRGLTPNLAALAADGVTTPAMHPSFPSITFPNHYTLVTGDRPDRHGVVGNTMTDPDIPNAVFRMSARDITKNPRWWDEATPVWVSAEQHGLPAATLFWPGSEVEIHGVRPSHWLTFNEHMASDDRADKLLSWFDAPSARRPRFATLYLNTVDSAGHEAGPDSPEVAQALKDVDAAVGCLETGLRARHIAANIIVVADHGMAAVAAGQTIAISDLLPEADYAFETGGAYAGIAATDGHDAQVARALLAPHPHMQCWRREALPERFHYGHNPRVPPFICLAEPGWVISGDHAARHHVQKGTHGYDPMAPSMQALFIAHGPAFARGRTIAPFDNVDVYPLMMALLGLVPEPNDGTIAPFRDITTFPATATPEPRP